MSRSDKDISRLLSLVLRHEPQKIGLTLDQSGWASVEDLLARLPVQFTRSDLDRIVAENDKKRFAFSGDGTKIRAQQGHSITVDLELVPQTPPATLFHGTAQTNLSSIMIHGLDRRARQHVHLSADPETAIKVGARHGSPVVLIVDATRMTADGRKFFLSGNGVWLTDSVPPEYLTLREG